MKKLLKKLALSVIIVAAFLSLGGCGKDKTPIAYDESSVLGEVRSLISLYATFEQQGLIDRVMASDDEELLELESFLKSGNIGIRMSGDAFKSGLDSYLSAQEDYLGQVVDIDDSAFDVSSDEDEITCHITLIGSESYSNGKPKSAEVEALLTKSLTITSIAVNPNKTFGEKIQNAALNTILGMGTTFAVLILISFVIYLMSYIPSLLESAKRRQSEQVAPSQPPIDVSQVPRTEKAAVAAPVRASSPAAGVGDEQLVAILAAAIAAYESERTKAPVSPDTFVVRSIRRR